MMFKKSILRAALTASVVFAGHSATASAEETSSCNTQTATSVLSFGKGFGLARCQDAKLHGLLIYDKNVSTENDGVLVLIETRNEKLWRFWSQLTLWGSDSQYNPELLALGRNYYEQSNAANLKQLLDYIAEIQKKLDSPHGKNTKVLKCESYQRKDQFCETGIDLTETIEAQVSVTEVYSRDKCTLGESFELLGTDLNVSKGCRATFTIKY
jgi:hypothetical protein